MSSPSSIVESPAEFRRTTEHPLFASTTASGPRAALLVAPHGFRLSDQSASDNLYMDLAQQVDAQRALAQHRVLAGAIGAELPARVFDGSAQTPDAVFPNNVFGTIPGRLIVGAMRHPERRLEAQRADIVDALRAEFGYAVQRLDGTPDLVCELTGPLVIDRARGIGFHGMSERLNRAGVDAMHAAFGLNLSFCFALIPGEYHTNVVMAVLDGRALVIHAGSFADPEVPKAIAELYGDNVVWLSDAEKAAFCANCISLRPQSVWMSATAERALSHENRHKLDRAGFDIHTVEIDEIEKAGGSLRCCVGELF